MRLVALTIALLALSAGQPAHAAWPSDPATNLPLADAPGDQVQPHLVTTSTGDVFVSWFDAIGNGFDVRVQALDTGGDAVFADEGVLVADRGFSSTQEYGLDVDAADHAVLAFRDDRFTGTQITAARVAPDGTLSWGTNGVQLTSTTDFVAAPRVTGTGDGGIVVAWTQEATTRVQKLDAGGVPQWIGDVVFTPGAGSYSVSGLHGDGTDVIISIVHQTGGFGSPRRLVAQKLDTSGSPLWGVDPVVVFDTGSLQNGNFPDFTPDLAGGAIFSWYDAATTQLQCYVQRLANDGSEVFAHNGVAVSTDATRVRVSPSVALDPVTDRVWAFWQEQNAAQSQSGVYGQLLDTDGSRLWGANGVVVLPLSGDDVQMIRAVGLATGPFAFWSRAASFGTDRLYGARLDGSGAIDVGPFDVASTPSGKSRLATVAASGQAILAWSDDRTDAGDILVQNVRPDGTLGEGSVGVEDVSPAARPGVPWPNPFVRTIRIPLDAATDVSERVDILDVAGRLVRRLDVSVGTSGVSWDGRDTLGRIVAPGRYYVRTGEVTMSISRLP